MCSTSRFTGAPLPLRASWYLGFTLSLVVASSATAHAEDRHTEAAAHDALKRTAADFRASAFDEAITRLQRAVKECGALKCTTPTRAALHRDLGVMLFRKGQRQAALASFVEARKLDPSIELKAPFDAPDVHRDWALAKEDAELALAAPTTGDFRHTPAPEQAVNVPVPVYFEYTGDLAVVSVALKYRGSRMSEYRRLPLTRTGHGAAHAGSGWGGLVPCDGATLGPLRYYVQGFDAKDEPVALSGDPKHPYYVHIRESLFGPPPSLPGSSPPAACSESTAHTEVAASEQESPRQEETPYRRVWIGLSGSVDVVPLPAGEEACSLDAKGFPTGAIYFCANADGSDFPSRETRDENEAIAPGHAGKVAGGPAIGGIRILASIDFALSTHFLLGARVGYVLNTFPGEAAAHAGYAFGPPLHFEGRATFLFGESPLAREGLAPYVFLGGGAANFGASAATLVTKNDSPEQLRLSAWRVSGPWFIGAGGGLRYAFSTRAAFLGAVKIASAFGGSGVVLAIGPELGVQYGF